jgi:hypothetical protein
MGAGIADDILRGVKDIAAFIGDDEKATNHKLATGKLPAGKGLVNFRKNGSRHPLGRAPAVSS